MKTKLLHIATFIALLSFPNVNFAQTPNLGTASTFALFTAGGAFDNDTVGATYVKGDIGTHAGAFNGFPPGILVGQIHVEDSISEQAANDVDSMYSYLLGISCDSVLGDTLGNKQVLTANVYCLNVISTLTGDLTLDGQGNPDALFIFKIDGAFSTSKFSNIILINSASLSNVYWQINGAIELGDSSVFRGTIVANGAISLLESSSLLGRGLSRLGAIYLHNNMVSIIETSPENTLPIELLSFNAKADNGFVDLTWSTTSETNNDYFTIEKNTDVVNFEMVTTVGGAGNSNTLLNYSVKDNEPFSGVSYYRLKQTDFDGKFSYSNLVTVDFEKSQGVTIYPNPFSTYASITINDASQMNNYELRIYNVLGTVVMNTIINKQLTAIETSNLPSGIYSYNVFQNDKNIQSGKLIAQQ